MSWTKKNVHPGKIVSTSQEVDVMVINTDSDRKRISLGLKQCLENPWDAFADAYPPGTQIEGPVRSITDFGLFVGLDGGIDGMVHISDISWDTPGEQAIKAYTKGDTVKATVLDSDASKERISLGIKQVGGDPFADATAGIKKGSNIGAIVSRIDDGGIEVRVGEVTSYIRRSDLGRDRADQRPERFAPGERVEARVLSINPANRLISLSIKAREVAEEKEAVRQFGSAASGAVLGEILAPALLKRDSDAEKQDVAQAVPDEGTTETPAGDAETAADGGSAPPETVLPDDPDT